jgi:hypothetical protein
MGNAPIWTRMRREDGRTVLEPRGDGDQYRTCQKIGGLHQAILRLQSNPGAGKQNDSSANLPENQPSGNRGQPLPEERLLEADVARH